MRPCFIDAAFGLVALLTLVAPLELRAADRPALAEDVEKRWSGHFLFATNGDGVYVIYERLDAAAPRANAADVVCLPQACFVPIARAPVAALDQAGRREQAERVRQSFRRVKEAFEAVSRAGPGERDAAERAWRAEAAKIGPCLADAAAC